MRRLGLTLLLAVQLALTPQSVGWPCPEDDGGACEVGCTDCASCGHSALGDVLEAGPSIELGRACVPEREVRPPPPPEPDDILHVPRAPA